MPTNPLWLEHTEKAAWDTVQTLRQQIETERARVQQLLRIQQNWPKILQALAEAKAAHGIFADEELAIVESLSAELVRMKSELAVLKETMAKAPLEQERARLALRDGTLSADRSSDGPSLARFVHALRELADENDPKRYRSQERLLAALEDKLEELEQAPRRELGEVAVEIAYLAFRVAADGAR